MKDYKKYFTDRDFIASCLSGLLLLAASLVVQFYASDYATRSVSGSVTDIVLSNTRVYNVDGIFIYGVVVLFFFVLLLCLARPRYLPFLMKSVAVFILIRAGFISLTHVNVYPLHVSITSIFFQKTIFRGIFTGSGLFFSGHTGTPFLLALMFSRNKLLRFIFLAFSIMFGFVVLLGHIHYSIDVLSAFFITYSIFHICIYLFKKDWETFMNEDKVIVSPTDPI